MNLALLYRAFNLWSVNFKPNEFLVITSVRQKVQIVAVKRVDTFGNPTTYYSRGYQIAETEFIP